MSLPDSDIAAPQDAAAQQPEAKKPSQEILKEEIREGLGALERPAPALFLSGLSAGLDVGFSFLLMAAVLTLKVDPETWPIRLLTATCYSVGFIFVVMGRSELFTEHTTLAVLPVLNRRARITTLAKVWAIVFASNTLGVLAFAWLASCVGPMLKVAQPAAFELIARRLLEHPPLAMFLSAMLAGWLMGLLSWLVAAARDTIGQLVIVWLITTTIGFLLLHHSIVGTGEVGAAMFLGLVEPAELGRFMLWTTLGNAVGGVVFVALIKYGHVMMGPGALGDSRHDHHPHWHVRPELYEDRDKRDRR